MKRYTTELIKHNGVGKQRYATLYYQELPFQSTDIYIMSRQLERVDLLAHQYYGDETLWWVIQKANQLPMGTIMIPPGYRIRIPYPLNLNLNNNE